VLLTDSPDEQTRLFLQSPVVGDTVKEDLRKAQGLRREWARAQREAGERRRQLQAVAEDQTRPRANPREVPQPSPLHQRYLDKLGKQEDEVEKYRADIKRLQDQEHARRKALDDFLAAFSARPALRGNRRGPPARLDARGTPRPARLTTACRFPSAGVEARPHRDDPASVSVQPRE
jgi:hypothetical protein